MLSPGKACTTCCAVHSALGLDLTSKCRTRRPSSARISITKKTRNVALGTTKKSSDTKSLTWLSKKVRQVGDGGFLCRTMYLATVDRDTSMPILASSFRIRGAPQVGLEVDILRIKARTSRSNSGRPFRRRLFCVQKWRNPSRCQRMAVAGCTMARICCHPDQTRDRTTHNFRSDGLRQTRLVPSVRFRTPIWWRRARFSRAAPRRLASTLNIASQLEHACVISSRISLATSLWWGQLEQKVSHLRVASNAHAENTNVPALRACAAGKFWEFRNFCEELTSLVHSMQYGRAPQWIRPAICHSKRRDFG